MKDRNVNHKILTLLFVFLDSIIIIASIFITWFLSSRNLDMSINKFLSLCIVYIATYLFFGYLFNMYNRVWKYASTSELITIVKTVVCGTLAGFLVSNILMYILNKDSIFNLSLIIVPILFNILMIGATRFIFRISDNDHEHYQSDEYERVLIFGAGRGGTLLARQMMNVPAMNMKPIAFLDDDQAKVKKMINGIKVIGSRQDLADVIQDLKIDKVVIAIPSLARNKIQELYEICSGLDVNVQIMPNIDDILTGKTKVSYLKDIDLEDLLGRESVKLDIEGIREVVNNKTILITGAGGSIGSEIVRQVASFGPKNILLLGHGENSIYNIVMEMKSKFKNHNIEFVPLIADIQDRKRIFNIFEKYKPEIVYHAAAHKHVPLMEANPREAIKNNILGTRNIAEASDAFGVKTFVLVSTDKAVNPPNIMGATKRWAEMIIQNMDKRSSTKFVAVRFGNVLGSRGSVIPLFKKQIEEGGPLTVTHPDITRYFMTIPEASRLVIQAGVLAKGGEVFVLDMGEPVKIANLAKNVIELAGYSVDEIGIEYTGLRPGEKMYEELLNENEVSEEQVHEKIYVGKANPKDYAELMELINNFSSMSDEEVSALIISEANKKFGLN